MSPRHRTTDYSRWVRASVVTYLGNPAEVRIIFSQALETVFIQFFLGNLLPRWEKLITKDDPRFEVYVRDDRIIFKVPEHAADEMCRLAVEAFSSICRPIRTEKCVYCRHDFRDLPPEAYQITGDGRQAKHLWNERQRVADFLASFANPDGTSITVGIPRVMEKFGMSKKTVHRRLNDLKKLGMLVDGEKTSFQGTRERALRLVSMVSSSAPPMVSSSDPNSVIYGGPEGSKGVKTCEDDTLPIKKEPKDGGPERAVPSTHSESTVDLDDT